MEYHETPVLVQFSSLRLKSIGIHLLHPVVMKGRKILERAEVKTNKLLGRLRSTSSSHIRCIKIVLSKSCFCYGPWVLCSHSFVFVFSLASEQQCTSYSLWTRLALNFPPTHEDAALRWSTRFFYFVVHSFLFCFFGSESTVANVHTNSFLRFPLAVFSNVMFPFRQYVLKFCSPPCFSSICGPSDNHPPRSTSVWKLRRRRRRKKRKSCLQVEERLIRRLVKLSQSVHRKRKFRFTTCVGSNHRFPFFDTVVGANKKETAEHCTSFEGKGKTRTRSPQENRRHCGGHKSNHNYARREEGEKDKNERNVPGQTL